MFHPFGIQQQFLSTALGSIAYYTFNTAPWVDSPEELKDRDTLVFLHGFGGGSSAYEWSKVYPAFASEYRIIAPDLIGWGNSQHPAKNYYPQDYVDSIIEFLQKTTTSPSTVIASSLTAAFTIRAAILQPELFKRLILVIPSGLSDFGNDYRQSFFAQVISTPVIDKILYNVGIANPAGINNFLENRQFANPERIYPEIVQAYLESAQKPNADYAALSFVRGDLCFDLAEYIPQLTTPTAFIWGKKARFTSVAVGERMVALNPQVIKFFHVIEETGLTPQLELPAVTIGLIYKLLKSL